MEKYKQLLYFAIYVAVKKRSLTMKFYKM